MTTPSIRGYDLPLSNDIIIQTSGEFHRMLSLLGYSLSHAKEEHYSIMRGNKYIVTITENFYKHRTPGYIIDYLTYFAGQHHMMCKKCHTPLLRYINSERATHIMQRLANPSMIYVSKEPMSEDEAKAWLSRYPSMLPAESFASRIDPNVQAMLANAVVVEYRETKQGPKSAPLRHCPRCHQHL